MNRIQFTADTRQAATSGLAVVGFIALVAAGIWLAVYSARFVPSAVNRIGAAAVSISSLFQPSSPSSLSVVPNASSTAADNASSTAATSTATVGQGHLASNGGGSSVGAPLPSAGKQTSATYALGASTTPALYGKPDLIVTIDSTGYLASTTADSFVASSTVPAGARPAVEFTVKNIGTNKTGSWRFSAQIPTQTAYVYKSIPQQSLNPGESIQYTLGFTQAKTGAQPISITANFDKSVDESNAANDTASTTLTVLGS